MACKLVSSLLKSQITSSHFSLQLTAKFFPLPSPPNPSLLSSKLLLHTSSKPTQLQMGDLPTQTQNNYGIFRESSLAYQSHIQSNLGFFFQTFHLTIIKDQLHRIHSKAFYIKGFEYYKKCLELKESKQINIQLLVRLRIGSCFRNTNIDQNLHFPCSLPRTLLLFYPLNSNYYMKSFLNIFHYDTILLRYLASQLVLILYHLVNPSSQMLILQLDLPYLFFIIIFLSLPFTFLHDQQVLYFICFVVKVHNIILQLISQSFLLLHFHLQAIFDFLSFQLQTLKHIVKVSLSYLQFISNIQRTFVQFVFVIIQFIQILLILFRKDEDFMNQIFYPLFLLFCHLQFLSLFQKIASILSLQLFVFHLKFLIKKLILLLKVLVLLLQQFNFCKYFLSLLLFSLFSFLECPQFFPRLIQLRLQHLKLLLYLPVYFLYPQHLNLQQLVCLQIVKYFFQLFPEFVILLPKVQIYTFLKIQFVLQQLNIV